MLNVSKHYPYARNRTLELARLHKSAGRCHRPSLTRLYGDVRSRFNALGIQMLSESLHKQLFGDLNSKSVFEDGNLQAKVEQHLKEHDLLDKSTGVLDDVNFELPKMRGQNLDEHILAITKEQVKPYISLADEFLSYEVVPTPRLWEKKKGWHRYGRDGSVVAVEHPEECGLVLDVEVLVKGNYPVMATALSKHAWYSWCSDRLLSDDFIYSMMPPRHKDLIPMEPNLSNGDGNSVSKHRLVLGHNVGFDRSYVKEQYFLKGSKMRFLDTMSMHIAMYGFSSFQRVLFNAKKKGTAVPSQQASKKNFRASKDTDTDRDFEWMDSGSLNSLNDVYKYHCGEALKKEAREIFIEGTISDINASFQDLMAYCAQDTLATHTVYKKLWPEFRKSFPNPVTFAGMLELGSAYLPVNGNWGRYLESSDKLFFYTQDEISKSLANIAADVCSEFGQDGRYKDDPWLYDLDWMKPELKLLKEPRKAEKADERRVAETQQLHPIVRNVLETANRLPKRLTHMPGVPRWYAELHTRESDEEWRPGPSLLTTNRRIAPKLLKLTWDGYPLYHHSKYGWGYIVPYKVILPDHLQPVENDPGDPMFPYWSAKEIAYKGSESKSANNSNADHSMFKLDHADLESSSLTYKQSEKLWKSARVMTHHQEKLFYENKTKVDDGPYWHKGNGPVADANVPGGWFFKLPHKDGESYNIGNPLSKDFLSHIEDGTLSSAAGTDATRVLLLSKQLSYWKNNRDRIRSQMVVWLNHADLPSCVREDSGYYPQESYGAILPRIVTAGTITRRAVEKTWLTASNSKPDRIGSELKSMIQCPPGYHFVGADVDSQELWIASLLGDAHFAGMHGSTALGWMTLQGKRSSGTDLHSKTAALIGISRDQAKVFNYGRIYGAGKPFAEKLLLQFNHRLRKEEAKEKAEIMYKATKGTRRRQKLNQTNEGVNEDYFDNNSPKWQGGSESEMFNSLEATAVSMDPRTPVLRCRITKALQPQNVQDGFMTSRINWVVQSSAVDYLHLMLVLMRWLFDEFRIDGRFCISIHDEVRYLVKSEDRYRAALALHITNLYTRAIFSYKVGIFDLPQSVAFFSGVDIDKCLRKETNMECKTPSNVRGMQGSYNIPPGECLDIYQALKMTAGSLVSSRG